jgi:hypothetical protein
MKIFNLLISQKHKFYKKSKKYDILNYPKSTLVTSYEYLSNFILILGEKIFYCDHKVVLLSFLSIL